MVYEVSPEVIKGMIDLFGEEHTVNELVSAFKLALDAEINNLK